MWTRVKNWLFVPGFVAVFSAVIRYTLSFQWDVLSFALTAGGLLLLIASLALNWEDVHRFYKRRSTVYLTFSLVSVLVLMGILFLINFIVFLHPQKLDLTEKKFFTLSDQTTKLLSSLNRDINVAAFYKENDQDMQLEYLLRQYRSLNHRFAFRFVDPDRDPSLAQSFGVVKYKMIFMEGGGKRLRVDEPTEGGLTNTLLKLSQDARKSVYFLTGHGEHNTDSEEREGYNRAKTALEETNYDVKLLNLNDEKRVPQDCAALVVAGARAELGAQEMAQLENYLSNGGSLFLLADPKPATGFETLMAGYGVRVGNDVVIDASGSGRTIGAGPEVPLIQNYFKTDITARFTLATFYPRARSVTPMAKLPDSTQVIGLMQTSRSSWGETELGPGGGGARYDEGKDLPGPVTLAVEVVRTLPSKKAETRIVMFGDSDFATNVYFNAQGNGDLFLNSVNWLTWQTDIIAIRPKKPENKRLDLTAQSNTVVFYICVLLMPAIPLVGGVWILVKRLK